MYYVPSALSASPTAKGRTTWCGIEFYWAKIGHGKTYHCVKERLLTALIEGRHVYTNINFGGPLKILDTEVFSEEQRAGMILSDYLKKDVRNLFHIVNDTWVKSTLTLGVNNDEFTAIPNGSRIIHYEVGTLNSCKL